MILYCKNQVIICGDFNSHNPIWGSKDIDANGRTVEEFMHKHDLVLLNEGTSTRIDPHTGRFSCLDLTFVTKELAKLSGWSVQKQNFGSDHFLISFDLPFVSKNLPKEGKFEKNEDTRLFARSSLNKVDWKLYKMEIKNQMKDCKKEYQEADLQGKLDILNGIILISIDKLTKKVSTEHKARQPVHWWTKECTESVKSRNAAKKSFHV